MTFAYVALTLAAYLTARRINGRWPNPLTTIPLVATILIAGVLCLGHVGLTAYAPARDGFASLLGPATVALAIPLYANRTLVGRTAWASAAGLVAGAAAGVAAAVSGAWLFGISHELRVALAIKSVTASVAAELAVPLRVDPSLVVVVVIATGMFGAALGPWLLDRANVRDPIARGIAVGTISHGIGTARIAAEDPASGAAAGSAMCAMATAVSIVAAIFIR